MRQKSVTQSTSSEQVVKDIRRATRKQYSAEEKIRIVLDGLRGVRRQINMDRLQPDRQEALVHLGFSFKRLACGDASVEF